MILYFANTYKFYFKQTVEKKTIKVQADDPIRFGQLAPKNELGQTEDMFELTLSQALGGGDKKDTSTLAGSKLNKVKKTCHERHYFKLVLYLHMMQV